MITRLVRIVLDRRVLPGMYEIGGVRIADLVEGDDAALGRELRTVQVRCHGQKEADAMKALVAADEGLELA